jgi:hypothetical protein
VLHVPHVGMVYESEHAMLSELQRKISARKEKKKKEEGVWRDLCIFFCGVAAAAIVLLLLLFAPLGRVEASGTELVHAYGGTGSEIARCVIEHSIDQGLVIAGNWQPAGSFGAGSYDIILVKTDSVGTELWSKTYGGSGDDIAYCVIEHSIDQGLVLAGETTSNGAGSNDFMLVMIKFS